jgi:predicted CXXCH cytochrome family protein
MRKILIIGLVALLSVVFMYGFADAKVSGACVNCHTMHNSQNGSAMATYGGGTGPNEALTRGNCLGCHAYNTTGGANIVTIGGSNIPQVWHAGTDLAAGNFRYYSDSHNRVHNVEGIVAQDATLANTPPGFASAYDPAASDFSTSSRLQCAGRNGCHGNRDQATAVAAIKGAHHYDDSAILKFTGSGPVETSQGGGSGGTSDYTTTGKSYRFLYNVHGGEETSWSATNTVHNEYKGATFVTRESQTWADITTISDLCAECHGYFHMSGSSGIGTASPWLRHPTDAIIPNTGEYASMTTTYNIETPVARQTIPASITNTVTAGTDVVMCLSCHYAHGSNYPDILRFDYSTITTAGTKCLRCHTGKSTY